MAERIFNITKEHPILHIPVLHAIDKWYVKVEDTETAEQFAEFHIGMSTDEISYYYPMYLYELIGKQVKLSCKDENVPDELFDGIIQGSIIEDHPDLYPNIYHEKERQQIHFSSRRGWLNDPNGLFYDGEKFHMYYQHNPYGPYHSGVNISWGHAVSVDGIHFKEYPDAIRPQNSVVLIASGSVLLDSYNITGLGCDTVLAAYTVHGSLQYKGRNPKIVWSQMLVHSTDGGYTFKPFGKGNIIEVPEGECWRDPKILFVDDGTLCIAVFETYEGKNCVSFYSSKNGHDWKFESRTMDLYECPDLFPIEISETGERLWVLYGGRGMYRVGRFENYKFEQIGDIFPMDYGTSVFSGQTWNSHPDKNVRYHMAWISESIWNEGPPYPLPFSQSMTLMCRLSLHKTKTGYRLFRAPTDALKSLRSRSAIAISKMVSGQGNTVLQLPVPGDTELTLNCTSNTQILVNGQGFTYDPTTNKLSFTSGKEYTLISDGPLSVRVITDVRSVEFFICDEISATYSSLDPEKEMNISGTNYSLEGQMWNLNSIWEKN